MRDVPSGGSMAKERELIINIHCKRWSPSDLRIVRKDGVLWTLGRRM